LLDKFNAERRWERMNILAWLLVGLIGGGIARLLMADTLPGGIAGIVLTVLVGIAGAIVGGFISVALGLGNGVDDFDIGTIFLSVVGAMLLLFGLRVLSKARA
jgi:uncharacterized membrane protein YeaQ/YmgE (transglycosylase-associated protein family)